MRLSGVLLAIATAPYHGSLQQYTLEPIKELAAESDLNRFQKRLHSWHTAKAHELRVVQVSCGLAAAAIVSIFSWPDVPQTYWLARGLWYWSLSLAVWAFLIASQQVSVLATFKTVATEDEMSLAKKKVVRLSSSGAGGVSHYLVLYFWQCPSMHMSYSWVTFFLGLVIHICRPIVPLIRHGEWTGDTNVMILFLIAFGAGVINFTMCSVISRAKTMRRDRTHEMSFIPWTVFGTDILGDTEQENAPDHDPHIHKTQSKANHIDVSDAHTSKNTQTSSEGPHVGNRSAAGAV